VKVYIAKKSGDKTYTADAVVNIHGIEKTWNLPFEVVASTADSVTVKFSQKFVRADFAVGTAPDLDKGIKPELELTGQLTIKKT
jgi:polyisoprenoid-binding protein YceI